MSDDVQTELLRDAVRWLRFQSIDKAKDSVGKYLDTDEKKAAFEMADGANSARSVAPRIGVSRGTIDRWWGDWYSAGILDQQEGVYKKIFSLSDLGITVPALTKTNGAAVQQTAQKRQAAANDV